MSHITIRFSRFLFLSLLVTLGAIGCSKTPEQKVEDAAQKVETQTKNLDQANKEYAAEWQKYKEESAAQLAANAKAIAEAKAKIKATKAKNRAELDKSLADLEKKNAELEQRLETYKDEGSDNKWQAFKKGFKEAVDTVGSKIRKVFPDKD